VAERTNKLTLVDQPRATSFLQAASRQNDPAHFPTKN